MRRCCGAHINDPPVRPRRAAVGLRYLVAQARARRLLHRHRILVLCGWPQHRSEPSTAVHVLVTGAIHRGVRGLLCLVHRRVRVLFRRVLRLSAVRPGGVCAIHTPLGVERVLERRRFRVPAGRTRRAVVAAISACVCAACAPRGSRQLHTARGHMYSRQRTLVLLAVAERCCTLGPRLQAEGPGRLLLGCCRQRSGC